MRFFESLWAEIKTTLLTKCAFCSLAITNENESKIANCCGAKYHNQCFDDQFEDQYDGRRNMYVDKKFQNNF